MFLSEITIGPSLIIISHPPPLSAEVSLTLNVVSARCNGSHTPHLWVISARLSMSSSKNCLKARRQGAKSYQKLIKLNQVNLTCRTHFPESRVPHRSFLSHLSYMGPAYFGSCVSDSLAASQMGFSRNRTDIFRFQWTAVWLVMEKCHIHGQGQCHVHVHCL